MKWKVQKLFEKFPMVGLLGPRQSGKTQAIGIKSGQTMLQDFPKNLIHWREFSPASFLNLVYGGSEKFQQHGIGIRPWFDHSI
ncbi:MAG: hypothetical protein LBB18_02075 [Puniceicoccales bacterium]|nr:hypothetical protein [Puniceicoccales bacterium]